MPSPMAYVLACPALAILPMSLPTGNKASFWYVIARTHVRSRLGRNAAKFVITSWGNGWLLLIKCSPLVMHQSMAGKYNNWVKPPPKKKISEIKRRHLSSLMFLMLLFSRYYQCKVTENRFLGGVEPKLLLENNLSTVRYEICCIFHGFRDQHRSQDWHCQSEAKDFACTVSTEQSQTCSIPQENVESRRVWWYCIGTYSMAASSISNALVNVWVQS